MFYKDYIEERMNGMVDILESSDVVMEFFKLKKKEKRRFKEENTIEAVNKEINEIRDDIFKEIKKYRSLCEVIHGRLRLYTGSEIINSKVKKEDKTETHYYSGAEFNIIDMNIKAKPGEADPDIYGVKLLVVESLIKDILEEKYPRFRVEAFDLQLPFAGIKLILK